MLLQSVNCGVGVTVELAGRGNGVKECFITMCRLWSRRDGWVGRWG